MKRNCTIDTLKAFCILFVIIEHCRISNDITLFLNSYILDSAVPLFLMISGYLFYKSFNKTENTTKWISLKLIRFIVPYIIIFIIDTIYSIFFHVPTFRVDRIPINFITGGEGPGGYYIPIMVEFTLLFPVINKIINRKGKIGVVYSFTFNLIFEIVKNVVNLDSRIYRLLIFRYLFVIAYGVYSSTNEYKESKMQNIVLLIIGSIYITMNACFDYHPVIFNQWSSTSMVASMFWIPICLIFMQKEMRENIFSKIGKFTYDIFLIQMLYFGYIYQNGNIFDNMYSNLVISIVICVLLGYIYNRFEKSITDKIIGYVKNKI